MQIHAPAKLNLCLYLGARRDDGLHELCSLFEPLALADLIEVERGRSSDEVVCAGVEGENLATRALVALRERGWGRPPLRVEIEKRIPVAAGLGGGSADAAAVLRLAAGEVADLEQIAGALGADVPSQLTRRWPWCGVRGRGSSGCRSRRRTRSSCCPAVAGSAPPRSSPRPTGSGLGRSDDELAELAQRLRAAAGAGASPLAYPELLVNDLEPAARSLRPEIGAALDALREAGAPQALLTGSGPTAFGLFDDLAAAREAAERARSRRRDRLRGGEADREAAGGGTAATANAC